jgi:hypothetical protein
MEIIRKATSTGGALAEPEEDISYFSNNIPLTEE